MGGVALTGIVFSGALVKRPENVFCVSISVCDFRGAAVGLVQKDEMKIVPRQDRKSGCTVAVSLLATAILTMAAWRRAGPHARGTGPRFAIPNHDAGRSIRRSGRACTD